MGFRLDRGGVWLRVSVGLPFEVSRLGMLQGFRAKGRPYRGGLGLRAWGLGDSRPEIEAGV